jgi:hypothetical protein
MYGQPESYIGATTVIGPTCNNVCSDIFKYQTARS